MSLDAGQFVDHLRGHGIDLFTGVPDSLLKDLCSYISSALPHEQHVIAANEGAAIAVAMGHYLGTGMPATVYMQNSGIGNAVNPLMSLAVSDVYGIPMLLLVGWRGQPGASDEPQHLQQGRVMEALLDAIELPWDVLDPSRGKAEKQVSAALDTAVSHSTPYVLLIPKGTFAATSDEEATVIDDTLPSREEMLAAIVDETGDDAFHIATTGMLGRELFELRGRAGGADRGHDFLTVGGMGHASSIALGLAMSAPEHAVWCFDGDGAVLMHLGSLAVMGDRRPANLFHVVFNNGVHDSVGGQPTSIRAVDLPALALACGYTTALAASSLCDVPDAVAALRAAPNGPRLLELKVRPGNRPGIGRPDRTPRQAKHAFMTAVDG